MSIAELKRRLHDRDSTDRDEPGGRIVEQDREKALSPVSRQVVKRELDSSAVYAGSV